MKGYLLVPSSDAPAASQGVPGGVWAMTVKDIVAEPLEGLSSVRYGSKVKAFLEYCVQARSARRLWPI